LTKTGSEERTSLVGTSSIGSVRRGFSIIIGSATNLGSVKAITSLID
jgi:hypothetical protein